MSVKFWDAVLPWLFMLIAFGVLLILALTGK